MKKLLVFFSMMAMVAVISINLTSCEDDVEPVAVPTVRLQADIDPEDQYTVILAVQETDAAFYAWDYGNGETSTTNGAHTYTYAASGDYTVSVTVTNESGSATATEDVTINPSIEEMLAGVDAEGKSWVMTQTPQANDGAGPLHQTDFNITLPFALVPNGDALAYVGFPDEYDNVFIFKPDGSYSVDNGNGQTLCTQIFAYVNTGGAAPGDGWTKGELGFATMPWTIESNATWAVDEDATIALDVMSDDPSTATDYTPMSVSYEGITQVTITGGYFGMLDMTNYVIIENITPDEMQIVLIMHTEIPDIQSIFTRITLIPQL
ncbi:MAG: PKD domain-containing protein [Draconibacterium sp.]|nr:PKD domain-containing protein [Draconibacterium sp.]